MTRRATWFYRTAGWIVLSAVALSPTMGSQLPPDDGEARVGLVSGMPPSFLKNGPVGELLAVFTPRSSDEIERLLNLARSDQESSQTDIAQSRRLTADADGRALITSEEVRTTKARLSVAKKAKNDSDQTTMETELKRQESELQYINRLRDSQKADAARLDSQSAATAARVKALELEADVSKKHSQISAASVDSPTDILEYRNLLKQMLAAQQNSADRAAAAASNQKEVATRRLKQLDALSKLSPPQTKSGF